MMSLVIDEHPTAAAFRAGANLGVDVSGDDVDGLLVHALAKLKVRNLGKKMCGHIAERGECEEQIPPACGVLLMTPSVPLNGLVNGYGKMIGNHHCASPWQPIRTERGSSARPAAVTTTVLRQTRQWIDQVPQRGAG